MESGADTQFETTLATLDRRARRRRFLTVGFVLAVLIIGCGFAYWATRQVEASKQAETRAKETQADIQSAVSKSRQANILVSSGAQKAHQGNFDAALNDYNSALQLDPSNSPALQLKGYLLYKRGDQTQAIELLKQAVASDPNYVWAHYNLALAFWSSGDSREALAQVKEVLKLDSSFREIFQQDGQFKPYLKTSKEFRTLLQ